LERREDKTPTSQKAKGRESVIPFRRKKRRRNRRRTKKKLLAGVKGKGRW